MGRARLAARLLSHSGVDWLLRRNFWMVKLFGVLTITALAANTTTTLLTFWLLSSAAPRDTEAHDDADGEGGDDDGAEDGATLAAATASATPRNDHARRAERNAERILGYSPFCPTCGPADVVQPEAVVASIEPGTTGLAGAQRSTLPLVVAATMEAEDPARSLATLVDTTRGVGGLFGVGDQLGPNVEILSVTTGVVHISNAGKLEYIPFDALPVGPAPKPESKVEDGKGKDEGKPADDSRKIPGAEEAIQCSGKGDCVVDRAFVEQLFSNPKLLLNQGGATPTTTSDGAPGFKLRGVRKGTLADLLGLKNGDVITEVGGSPLTMDVLPGLYGKLRHASHLEVTVDRKGDRMTRQLEIRS